MSTVYVRGINRSTTEHDISKHFATIGSLSSVSFSESPRQGYCWVTYLSSELADRAVVELHHSNLNGSILSIRHELGSNTVPISTVATKATVACVPRIVKLDADGRKNKKARNINVSYTGRGIMVDGTEYPSPQGLYLMKLLKLSDISCIGNRQPLMSALLNIRHGNKHAKELSESMAMVNAVQKLGHLTRRSWENYHRVNVYTLADGIAPCTSMTMCLYFPSWTYTSIDPILDFDTSCLGGFHSTIRCVNEMSQNFVIATNNEVTAKDVETVESLNVPLSVNGDNTGCKNDSSEQVLSIVIACHSHAPLQEFWDRVPCPKLCVSMPCCGKSWSNLNEEPLEVYDDFEVFSPKRRIFLYHSSGE